MEYTRNTKWMTHLGDKVTPKTMKDEHLANTVQFLTHYNDHPSHRGDNSFLDVLKEEVRLRGLTQEFLDKAPYPYEDHNRNWVVWDYKINRTQAVFKWETE